MRHTYIGTAQQLVKQTGDLSVPIHLRKFQRKLKERIGLWRRVGKVFTDYQNNFAWISILPDELKHAYQARHRENTPSEF
jgi:putative ATPase